jgi:hypothetical protein
MPSAGGPVRVLERLMARGETLAGLERLLRLSPGYLSKVRRRRVVPSAQLVALLDVLAKHPEVRGTLLASGGTNAAAQPARASKGAPAVPPAFLRSLTEAWTASRVRFHGVDDLLLAALRVESPRGLEPSVRFLVHPDDRHSLSEARALGASVAMASSRASVCTPMGTDASIVVVFPLAPLHHLFDKVRLTAVDAALYFALQGGEEAERRLHAVAKEHALGRSHLERSFARTYGDAAPLPAKEWLLRATFDPEGARRRIAELP